MSNLQPPTNSSLSSYEDAAKTHALICYGLLIAGLFTGVFWIIGAIWAMLKKSDAEQSAFRDHYTNVIKIFWWGLFFSIIGFVTLIIFVGYFVLIAVWIWSIYRILKGLSRISSNRSYYL